MASGIQEFRLRIQAFSLRFDYRDEGSGFRGKKQGFHRFRGSGVGFLEFLCIDDHMSVQGGVGRRRDEAGGDFSGLQDNAEKFQHNKNLTEGRQRRLQEAGAFRAPTNAARSFQPQYGPASSYDSMVVRGTDGSETLLKPWPVPRGQRRARGPAHPAAGALGGPTAPRLQPRPSTSTAHINASRMRSSDAIPVRRQRGSPAGAVVARVEASRPPAGYRLRVVRAVLHSGTLRLWRQRSLPLKGFRQPSRLRGSHHFLRSRFPDGTWTSIAVVLNPRIGLHRDILNMIGKPNHAIALGSFTGGRIWVEDDDGTSSELRVTKRNTQQL